jgi:uncharacterized protein DUF3108
MKRVVPLLGAGLCVLLAGGLVSPRAEAWPAVVRATYDVNFNGINVGTFEFEAHTEGQSYSLSGTAQLTVLLFSWVGEIRTFGLLSANRTPKPAAFSFEFQANGKTGSTRIDFVGGNVTDVKHTPQTPPKADTVPLREQHLKGVLDPLSALLVVANYANPDPCDRRLPIFDGRERFDLVMSYKGQTKVSEQQPSGQPAIAHVCSVKYRPIAGHQVDAENSYLATTDGIELSLRPVPSANILVPYQITIPTLLGYATIVSKRVEIETPGSPQIALLH